MILYSLTASENAVIMASVQSYSVPSMSKAARIFLLLFMKPI